MLPQMYAKLITAALVLAAIIGGFLYVKHLRSEVKTLTSANAVITSKLEDQNTAIEVMKKEADEREAKGKIEISKAKEAAAKNKVKAKIIYRTKPSTPGTSCEADRTSALDLVNGVQK
jgi:hypothetical protein